ncbi:MurR/RpiR family transcriptional regulator [Sphingoaurantiacus capsulatus]|uniref:MurR/RpiR family transcriptional regulator n=1 Tax=Sphingoaurantiacus capsulatus TaxID=1771310 RepID=A0ABV7XBJ9_9SPHN
MASSLARRLVRAAATLPPQLSAAARYVADHPFDAASLPMRALARGSAQSPTTYTRLARSLGFGGWDELRAALLAEAREDLDAARAAPFSSRPAPDAGVAARMLAADQQAIGAIDTVSLEAAADVLEAGARVFVAGFRSCAAPAAHFHYLYRLFRPEVALIGTTGALDLDLGGLRRGDALLLFGFAPYSRDGLMTAQAALAAGARLVVVADDASAPPTKGADAVLTYDAGSPGFFPSLTACTALLQALAETLYLRAGAEGRAQLQASEARIAAHTAYVSAGRL